MRAPKFWTTKNLQSTALIPLSWIYRGAGMVRRALARPFHTKIPVVCVGNLTVGGSGKTPVTLAVVACLQSMGKNVHILCYGYGGTLKYPVRVAGHTHHEVGDEAILLSRVAPTWVGKNRAHAAHLAQRAGADILVMDDGFQYPYLHKNLNIVVVDGSYGFGNARVMPAGPLRESLTAGLARADAFIIVGEDHAGVAAQLPVAPYSAAVRPTGQSMTGQKVVAFAGIGRPEKFFNTLEREGVNLIKTYPFPDHYMYMSSDLMGIYAYAEKKGAVVVTTTKDAVKLPTRMKEKTVVFKVNLAFEGENSLLQLLKPVL